MTLPSRTRRLHQIRSAGTRIGSEASFFLKEVDAQVDFVRDAQGNPTGLVLHQNGQNITAQRMPNGG